MEPGKVKDARRETRQSSLRHHCLGLENPLITVNSCSPIGPEPVPSTHFQQLITIQLQVFHTLFLSLWAPVHLWHIHDIHSHRYTYVHIDKNKKKSFIIATFALFFIFQALSTVSGVESVTDETLWNQEIL